MKEILRIGKGVKVRRTRVKEICELPSEAMEVDVKVELIQALIPIGLGAVADELKQEVNNWRG